jgi:hypothetical protein
MQNEFPLRPWDIGELGSPSFSLQEGDKGASSALNDHDDAKKKIELQYLNQIIQTTEENIALATWICYKVGPIW